MSQRVGIATYINSCNYGSALQAYALKKYICSLGYDAEIIDFTDLMFPHNRKMRKLLLRDRLLCCAAHPSLLRQELLRRNAAKRTLAESSPAKKALFEAFQRDCIGRSTEDYFDLGLFDAFVCGSDQVWKISVPGLHPFFFLRFASPDKRIAYAPSFGGYEIPAYNRKKLQRYLQEFPFLSIREASGVEVIRSLTGREAPQVLDPVLLVGPDFWRKQFTKGLTCEEYLLCYFLDDNPEGLAFAEKIARENGWSVRVISDDCKCDGHCTPAPMEFVQLIDSARYIVTDSFHGIAFSSMMNTPFSVFDRNYAVSQEQSTRVDSYLAFAGLESRKYNKDQVFDLNADCSFCNDKLAQARKLSEEYLKHALYRTVNVQED